MTSQQCADNGDICQNCVNIITEALQCFILSPFEEGRDSTTSKIKGKRSWHTRGDYEQVLSENQSSQFGTSPSECYVCFRSSQLAQVAGLRKVRLMGGPWSWNVIYLFI